MGKKLFSLTVHARSLSFSNLSDRWFVGFLNGFLFCQLFHRDPSHLPCNPLASLPPKILFCTNNDFEFPMSAFWQQLPDSWHHISLCLCRKRLQKATERLSPCQCLWLFHRHWQVTSVFFFYIFFFFSRKADRCLQNMNSGFRTRVGFLVPYLKSRSCSASALHEFFQDPSLTFSHSSLSPASKERKIYCNVLCNEVNSDAKVAPSQ